MIRRGAFPPRAMIRSPPKTAQQPLKIELKYALSCLLRIYASLPLSKRAVTTFCVCRTENGAKFLSRTNLSVQRLLIHIHDISIPEPLLITTSGFM